MHSPRMTGMSAWLATMLLIGCANQAAHAEVQPDPAAVGTPADPTGGVGDATSAGPSKEAPAAVEEKTTPREEALQKVFGRKYRLNIFLGKT